MKNERYSIITEDMDFTVYEKFDKEETISDRIFNSFKEKVIEKIEQTEKSLAMSAVKARLKRDFKEYERIRKQLKKLKKIKLMIELDSYKKEDIHKRKAVIAEAIAMTASVAYLFVGAGIVVTSIGAGATLSIPLVILFALLALLIFATEKMSKKLREYYLGEIDRKSLKVTNRSIMRRIEKKAQNEDILRSIVEKIDKYEAK